MLDLENATGHDLACAGCRVPIRSGSRFQLEGRTAWHWLCWSDMDTLRALEADPHTAGKFTIGDLAARRTRPPLGE